MIYGQIVAKFATSTSHGSNFIRLTPRPETERVRRKIYSGFADGISSLFEDFQKTFLFSNTRSLSILSEYNTKETNNEKLEKREETWRDGGIREVGRRRL